MMPLAGAEQRPPPSHVLPHVQPPPAPSLARLQRGCMYSSWGMVSLALLSLPPPYFWLGTLFPGALSVSLPPQTDNQVPGECSPLLGTEACVFIWNSWLQGPEGLSDS